MANDKLTLFPEIPEAPLSVTINPSTMAAEPFNAQMATFDQVWAEIKAQSEFCPHLRTLVGHAEYHDPADKAKIIALGVLHLSRVVNILRRDIVNRAMTELPARFIVTDVR